MRKKELIAIVWLAVAAIFCSGSAANGGNSPAGPDGAMTWDCSVTGANKGSAYLTFYGDYYVDGYMLVAPSPKKDSPSEITFGFTTVEGYWEYDSFGQAVGFLQSPPGTEERLDTMSFQATVNKRGDKITIKGRSTTNGALTFKGVVAEPLADISGRWTIRKDVFKDDKKTEYIQIFDVLNDTGLLNVYSFYGKAANLCVFGLAQLSKGNRLGVVVQEYELPESGFCEDISADTKYDTYSAAVGKINLQTSQARMSGDEEGDLDNSVKVRVLGMR